MPNQHYRQKGNRILAGGICCLLALGCDLPPEVPEVGPPLADPAESLRPDAQRGEVPQSARICDHHIVAHVDTKSATITARSRVAWRNTTASSVSVLPFHLYMNAFRATDTTWMSAAQGRHRGSEGDFTQLGYTDVRSIDQLGGPLTELPEVLSAWKPGTDSEKTALSFQEDSDPSLMQVTLTRPVAPQEVVVLELEWVTKLPSVFARSGANDPFIFSGQWFPKPGANTENGVRAHIYFQHSEFFADFGNYEVELNLPADAKLITNGLAQSEHQAPKSDDGEARVSRVFRAEMVHDFVWTVFPDYVFAQKRVLNGQVLARAAFATQYADQMNLQLDVLDQTMIAMEKRFGPYPWSTITIVQPPELGGDAGGMEYPAFFTTSPTQSTSLPRWLIDAPVMGEMTTVHEYGHQYFQGMLANDEHLYPWLDEGFNTFANSLIVDDIYGSESPAITILGHRLTHLESLRVGASALREPLPIDLTAAHFDSRPGAFSTIAYLKTANALHTLRNLVGQDLFDPAMRTYVDRFRFHHPTPENFKSTMIEKLGATPTVKCGKPDLNCESLTFDLAAFFEEVLNSANEAEYAATSLRHTQVLPTFGWHRDANGELVESPKPDAEPERFSVVGIARNGGLRIPVEVEMTFEDGTSTRRLWDAQDGSHFWRVAGTVVRVEIDPDNRLSLEVMRRNNIRWRASEGSNTPPQDFAALGLNAIFRSANTVMQILGGP
jgi:hypothetical protein